MAPLSLLWIVLAACALAAGQDAPPMDPCTEKTTVTEEDCLSYCMCAYCYPPAANATDPAAVPTGAAGGLAAGATQSKAPIVGCTDMIHSDRCVANYSTNYYSDECRQKRRTGRIVLLSFFCVIAAGLVLVGIYGCVRFSRRMDYVNINDSRSARVAV